MEKGIGRYHRYLGAAITICFIAVTGLYFRFHQPKLIKSPYYHNKVFTIPKDVKEASPSVRMPVKVPILLYHYVEYVKDKRDTIRQSLDIIPRVLEEQIQTLISDSYTFITMDELADYLDGKMSLPPKPVMLTFDDGYRDLYTDVLPILRKYHVKAVAYIVSGFVDKPNFMSLQELREVASSGLVEIDAHSVHHMNLNAIRRDLAEKEVEESKTAIEKLVGLPVHNFAYPYGDFNKNIIEMVQKAGYRTAASVVAGSIHSEQDRYFIYRLRPGARTGKALTSWLESRL